MKHLNRTIICLLILIGVTGCIGSSGKETEPQTVLSTEKGTVPENFSEVVSPEVFIMEDGDLQIINQNIADGKNIIAKYRLILETESPCSTDPNATITYKEEGNAFTVITECAHFSEEREITESMFNQSIFANGLKNSGIRFKRLKEENYSAWIKNVVSDVDYCMQSESSGTTFCSNSNGIITYIYTYKPGFVDTGSRRILIEYLEK